jgi:hypothetical protein
MFRTAQKYISLIIWMLLLAACSGSSQGDPTRPPASLSSDLEVARATLSEYFDDLAFGNYAAAADRYGGELNQLADWNPDIDPSNHSALFEAACTRQLQCLPVRSIVYASQVGDGSFTFTLEFSNADGSLFVLGPCCGANETEMPPVSQFDCPVEKSSAGDYKVMCLPVYVP